MGRLNRQLSHINEGDTLLVSRKRDPLEKTIQKLTIAKYAVFFYKNHVYKNH